MRRTPALTAQARDLFEADFRDGGWTPGSTVPRIAAETGLSLEQVRDAIFGASADAWRRALADRIQGGTLQDARS